MNEVVTPRLFRGLRDLLPDKMAARQRMLDTIRSVYEIYGFVPLGTPAVEYLEALTGSAGQEAQQSIFLVENPDFRRGERPASEKLGLRFDLTVPLARVVSQYRDLPRPFRRYQVSSVWRADKPDRGRFREFTQFDIDSVGVSSDVADTEIIAAMSDTLSALDVGAYRVRFSSRKVLNLLLSYAEIPERWTVTNKDDREIELTGADVFRVLDKLEKVGPERLRLELTTGYEDDSGDVVSGLGLMPSQVDRIEEFLAIRSDDRDEVLTRLRQMLSGVREASDEIDVLARISNQLKLIGYSDNRVVIDLSVARGLAYYTGPVFEAILLDAPHFGSVFGGGRYDDLVLRFLGERVPATGASIGVDRLLTALVELKRIKLKASTAQVLVTVLDQAMMNEYLQITFELRRAGIRTELYLGDKGIGKQIKHGDSQGIPIVLMYGPDEKKGGTITLKDLTVGRAQAAQLTDRAAWLRDRPGQVEAPRADIVAAVAQMLADGPESPALQ